MRIWKAVEFITNVFAFVAGILLLMMALFVSYSVTLRYLHFKPPIWILQFAEYALLWITFLGAPWLLRSEGHVRIDTFVVRLSPRFRRIAEALVAFLGFVVCSIIVWFGVEKTIDLYQRGVVDVKGISLPEFPLFLVIPVGAALLLLQFGRNVFRHLGSERLEGGKNPG